MVRVIIGSSGCGKTFLLKGEIFNEERRIRRLRKETCVIERREFNEYSHVFHPDFIKVIKPDSDLVNTLIDAKNMDIIIDCDYEANEFIEKVSVIVKNAEKQNNDVTITFLEFYPEERNDIYFEEKEILAYADLILVGNCCVPTEVEINNMFGVVLNPQRRQFDFRQISVNTPLIHKTGSIIKNTYMERKFL